MSAALRLVAATDTETAVLEMLDGRRELLWGAAVGAALEALVGQRLVVRSFAPPAVTYALSDAGLQALIDRDFGVTA